MLENVQLIQDNGQNKFAVIDFKEFVLLEDYLDYLHIQTVKKQDNLPRHSLNEVMGKLNIELQ